MRGEMNARRSGLWLLLGGFLLALGWRGCVVFTKWLKEPQLLREFDSIRQFEQDVVPNSANTRLVFCQDTADGIGIYYSDTVGGKPRLLCEQKEKGHSWKRFTMLGWARLAANLDAKAANSVRQIPLFRSERDSSADAEPVPEEIKVNVRGIEVSPVTSEPAERPFRLGDDAAIRRLAIDARSAGMNQDRHSRSISLR